MQHESKGTQEMLVTQPKHGDDFLANSRKNSEYTPTYHSQNTNSWIYCNTECCSSNRPFIRRNRRGRRGRVNIVKVLPENFPENVSENYPKYK